LARVWQEDLPVLPNSPSRLLTDLERKVADLIVEGRPIRQIAKELGISTAEVRRHSDSLKAKLAGYG